MAQKNPLDAFLMRTPVMEHSESGVYYRNGKVESQSHQEQKCTLSICSTVYIVVSVDRRM